MCSRPLRAKLAPPQQQTLTVLLAEQQLIGLDYNQVLFAAHPFNQMEWRRSSHGGRWGMVDTASGSRPSVVHWNGPAHWCKTAAGGFGHNFISDYQRAALRVVGFWHTPLSASRHFASQDICVLRSRIVAGTAMRCKSLSCSAVGCCRYPKTSQAEKRDWRKKVTWACAYRQVGLVLRAAMILETSKQAHTSSIFRRVLRPR